MVYLGYPMITFITQSRQILQPIYIYNGGKKGVIFVDLIDKHLKS